MNEPVCGTWPLPSKGIDYHAWNVALCAFCGRKDDTVLDHDHRTGLTRGYICRRCNRIESLSHGEDHPLFDAWAAWRAGCNPATILGQQEPYSGFGWRDGVNLLERYYGEPTEEELRAAADMLTTIFPPTDVSPTDHPTS